MPFLTTLLPRMILLPLAAASAVLAARAIAAELPAPSGAERWALRPLRGGEPAAAPVPAPTLRGAKAIPLSELPGERRSVRIVYQGYGPAGVLSASR